MVIVQVQEDEALQVGQVLDARDDVVLEVQQPEEVFTLEDGYSGQVASVKLVRSELVVD